MVAHRTGLRLQNSSVPAVPAHSAQLLRTNSTHLTTCCFQQLKLHEHGSSQLLHLTCRYCSPIKLNSSPDLAKSVLQGLLGSSASQKRSLMVDSSCMQMPLTDATLSKTFSYRQRHEWEHLKKVPDFGSRASHLLVADLERSLGCRLVSRLVRKASQR